MERANTLLRSLTARKRGIDSAEALISEGHNFENGEAILCTLTSVRRVYWKSLRSQADPASIIFGPLAKHSPSICTRRSSQCSPKIEGEVVSRKIFGPRHLECSRMSDLRGYRKFSDASRSHTSIDNHTALSTMSMLDKLAQNYIRQSLDGGIMI